MAEFNFYATRTESIAILADLLAAGTLHAYLDDGYHSTPDVAPMTIGELKKQLERWHRVLLGGDFSSHPPLLLLLERGKHAGQYFFTQTGGGPFISYDVGSITTEGPPTLVAGFLMTQPRYQLEPGRWEKPSSALKDAYADLVKRMKKLLVRHNGVWIAPKAMQLLQQGQVQLPAGLAAGAASRSTGSTPPAPPVPRAAAGK